MENFRKIPVVALNIYSHVLSMYFYYCEQVMMTHQDVMEIHESSTEGPRGWVWGKSHSSLYNTSWVLVRNVWSEYS